MNKREQQAGIPVDLRARLVKLLDRLPGQRATNRPDSQSSLSSKKPGSRSGGQSGTPDRVAMSYRAKDRSDCDKFPTRSGRGRIDRPPCQSGHHHRGHIVSDVEGSNEVAPMSNGRDETTEATPRSSMASMPVQRDGAPVSARSVGRLKLASMGRLVVQPAHGTHTAPRRSGAMVMVEMLGAPSELPA